MTCVSNQIIISPALCCSSVFCVVQAVCDGPSRENDGPSASTFGRARGKLDMLTMFSRQWHWKNEGFGAFFVSLCFMLRGPKGKTRSHYSAGHGQGHYIQLLSTYIIYLVDHYIQLLNTKHYLVDYYVSVSSCAVAAVARDKPNGTYLARESKQSKTEVMMQQSRARSCS